MNHVRDVRGNPLAVPALAPGFKVADFRYEGIELSGAPRRLKLFNRPCQGGRGSPSGDPNGLSGRIHLSDNQLRPFR